MPDEPQLKDNAGSQQQQLKRPSFPALPVVTSLTAVLSVALVSAVAVSSLGGMSSSSAERQNEGSLLDSYRFRSSWARAAYHKLQFDSRHMSDGRHPEWYRLERPHLLPQDLAGSFCQLEQDAETNEFLEASYAKSERLLTQLYHRLAKPLLSLFMSVTSANGLLRRGSMFVLSGAQFRQLLAGGGAAAATPPPHMEALLDLGAGDGNVTSRYAGFFRRAYVTELATVMTWRLAERGYTVVDPETWLPSDPSSDDVIAANGGYDLIGCFNLLDRCEAPLDLLAQARRLLKPGTGRLLLAVVVPVRQFCEFAPGNRPAQQLAIRGAEFEEQVASLAGQVFRPQGWLVERWTKAPYLCEGDLYQTFYHLTDAVFLLRPVEES